MPSRRSAWRRVRCFDASSPLITAPPHRDVAVETDDRSEAPNASGHALNVTGYTTPVKGLTRPRTGVASRVQAPISLTLTRSVHLITLTTDWTPTGVTLADAHHRRRCSARWRLHCHRLARAQRASTRRRPDPPSGPPGDG